MSYAASGSRRVGIVILIPVAAVLLGYFYVASLSIGWRAVVYVHGTILFFAGLAIFMKDAKAFLLFSMIFATAFGFGRHLLYEKTPFEAVLFSSGLRIDTAEAVLIVLYAHWIFSLGTRDDKGVSFAIGGTVGALLLSWMGYLLTVSLIFSSKPLFGVYETAVIFKGFLLFFYLVNNLRTRRDVKIVAYALMAVVLVQALYLVFQYITRTNYTIYGVAIPSEPGEAFRARGFFGGFDTHALFLVTVFPIFLASFLAYRDPEKRVIAGLSMLLILAGWIATQVRIGAVSIGLAGIIVLVMSYQRRYISSRQMAGLLVLVFFGIIVTSGLLYQRFASGPYTDRIPLMEMALGVISDHFLFGVGPNNYNFIIAQYIPPRLRGEWLYTVHTEYLLRLAETGIIGASLYYSILVVAIKKLWTASRSADRLIFSLSAGLFAALVASLIHRIVSIYHHQQYFVLYCIILSLAYVLSQMQEQEEAFGIRSSS
jgi:hypothetical protein